MSIEEIKDIKKLQKRLKSALEELKYIKKCCKNAGLELAKHSFSWDGKEKNLVIQALELNKRFERREQALDEIENKLNLLITITNEYDNCYYKTKCKKCKSKTFCQHYRVEEILNIINKAKDISVPTKKGNRANG